MESRLQANPRDPSRAISFGVAWLSLVGLSLVAVPPAIAQIPAEPALEVPPVDVRTLPMLGEPMRADAGLIEEVAEDPSRGPESARAEDPSGAAGELAPQQQPGRFGADELPAPPGVAEELPPGVMLREMLTPADVIASVFRSYPEIVRARQVGPMAQGELVEALGAYDLKLKAETISEPTGFYQNYRNAIGVARQTWWGTEVYGGYRIGRGVFQPWYRGRETEKGGEFKVGMIAPLLQGRAIDEQRVAFFRASLAQQAADPILQEALLMTSRDATLAYWEWVTWGLILEAQRELLSLAEERGEQFAVGFAAGRFAEIDVILNDQLIAERRGKVLDTYRKYRESAIKLSLYLRDGQGNPMLPDEEWLPKTFPIIEPVSPDGLYAAISSAMNLRPEPRRLQIEIRRLDLDRSLARNYLLPRLDLIVEGSKDVGEPGSPADDKGPFELIVGAAGEVPIQRRKAIGKLQSTNAKIIQMQESLRLQRDRIEQEVRAAYNDLVLASQIVEQSELSLRAAIETLDRYRFAFDRGKIDLIALNLLETRANETEITLIEAQQVWFMSLARFQASSGLDPIDQSAIVSDLPPSDRPGPGRLPNVELPAGDAFERDWQRRTGSGEP